ncbi:hypothetical protein M9H77_02419 [Catharanthus roseus]|uniref:Uncharacterized protein n=1 Tax=Catharanthus roseus TaxID=4058 RepID=A0ACC0C8N3_CATRO|nr:hypothetical protein M9H77_02419 [Catharanthus roseus]
MCIIASKGNFFLLVPSITNCLSSHFSLEDPLMSSSVMFDPSCYGFCSLDDTSLVELKIVGFVFEFDRNSIQHVCTITSMSEGRHTMERTKTLLFSMLLVEEAKEASLEELGAIKAKEIGQRPTGDGRSTILLPVGFWSKTVLRIRPTIDGRLRPTVAGRS